MKSMLLATLIVAAAASTASAQVGVSFRAGDVAIAYQDGYWDNHHEWHAWAHESDWKAFRNAHPEHYRDYTHDRDDHGH